MSGETPVRRKSTGRTLRALFAALFGYVIAFSVVEPFVDDASLKQYLRIFSPAATIARWFAPIIARHSNDLIAHGYLRRALVVEHIYAIDYIICFTFVIIVLLSAGVHTIDLRVRQQFRSWAYLMWIFAIAVLALLGEQTAHSFDMNIDWPPVQSTGYKPQFSNIYLFWFTVGLFGEILLIIGLRALLNIVRVHCFLLEAGAENG